MGVRCPAAPNFPSPCPLGLVQTCCPSPGLVDPSLRPLAAPPHPALSESLLTLESQGSQGPSEGLGRFACGGKGGGWGEGQASPRLAEYPPCTRPPACHRRF